MNPTVRSPCKRDNICIHSRRGTRHAAGLFGRRLDANRPMLLPREAVHLEVILVADQGEQVGRWTPCLQLVWMRELILGVDAKGWMWAVHGVGRVGGYWIHGREGRECILGRQNCILSCWSKKGAPFWVAQKMERREHAVTLFISVRGRSQTSFPPRPVSPRSTHPRESQTNKIAPHRAALT